MMDSMKLVALLLAALIAQEPGKQPVAWTLKKGEKVRYEFAHKIVQGDGDRTSDLALTLGVPVEDPEVKADGSLPATLAVERISYAKVQRGESESYDSARDKEPPAGSYPRVLSKCVGKSVSLQLTAAGKLTALDELRKLVQAGVDAWPDLKGRPKWNAEGVDRTARRLELLLRTGFETPKGGPAAVGDAWETKYEVEAPPEGRGTAVCAAKIAKFRPGEAVIDQAIRFEFDPGIRALVKEASGKGSLTWDTSRGVLKTLGATSKIVMLRGDVTHSLTIALLPDETPK